MATAWLTQAEEALREFDCYVEKHGVVEDEFVKSDRERLCAVVKREAARSTQFLLARGLHIEVDSYLGFGAAIIASSKRGQVHIVEVPSEHVSWQSLRLQSGMRGGQVYETETFARLAAGVDWDG